MPAKKDHGTLTTEERITLAQMRRRGQHATRRWPRARLLLKVAAGLRDDAIAAALEPSLPTVERTRKRFTMGRRQALEANPRPGTKPVLDERGDARLIAAAGTPAPAGRERWTLQVLADRLMADRLDNIQGDRVVGQEPQGPAGMPGGWLTTPERDQSCLPLAI